MQAASQAYFGKDVGELALHEAAFLAILPKAPERYGREGQEQAALARRNYVLNEMADNGFVHRRRGRGRQGETARAAGPDGAAIGRCGLFP